MNDVQRNIIPGNSNTNNRIQKLFFFNFHNRGNSRTQPFFTPAIDTDGDPYIQKQGGSHPQPQSPLTPCPSGVSIGTLAGFNHGNLPSANKDNWGTYLGVVSQMNVTTRP